MSFRLLSYPNKCTLTPDFYIQIKGEHSGRPLQKPIKNCIAVYSDTPLLFETVFLLFKGREFEPYIHGSVIPFIKINDVKDVINKGLGIQNPNAQKLLEQTKAIEELIRLSTEKIKTLKALQVAICREFVK